MDLHGKSVVITGGSRGLGLEIARVVAHEGGKLALLARDLEELERAKKELTDLGAQVLVIDCDTTSQKQVEDSLQLVRDLHGSIDVLINNAGRIQVGPLEEMTKADFEDELNIHFWAPLYATLAVLPEMKKRRSGRIVNISSIAGLMSVPHLLPYSASKHALAGFSEGLRTELIKDNVFVTTVCPGLMRTGSHINAEFKGQNKKEYALFTLSDAIPAFSIDSEVAAKQIVRACKNGDARLVISIQAKFAALAHSIFPDLYADIMGTAANFLPGPGGIGKEKKKGSESKSALAPGFLTVLADAASRRNNEVVGS